jgi:curved DNA-binding protein CbpA
MEEIKARYKELARKYHPDKYSGNELADLAQEKMKEINEAYDAIVREREGRGQSGGYDRHDPYGPYQQRPYGHNPYQQPPQQSYGCSACDCCSALLCADCLCSSTRCC